MAGVLSLAFQNITMLHPTYNCSLDFHAFIVMKFFPYASGRGRYSFLPLEWQEMWITENGAPLTYSISNLTETFIDTFINIYDDLRIRF